jgi:hypothetical protein
MANPTIGATTPRIQYTATASQTAFSVPFEFLANADLAVYVNGTLKTLTTDYTLTGANTTGGGTLTFVTGRTAGEIVTILGNLAYSRDTNKYTKYGLLPAEVLEADFDAVQVQAKQLALADQFAIRAPLTDTGTPTMVLPAKATRAGKLLSFDSNGNVSTTIDQDLVDLSTATIAAQAAQAAAEAAKVAAQLAQTNAETAETNAETAATNAQTAETNAETAETNAEAAQAAAELARDASWVNNNIFASTVAGLAATTSGEYFSVPSGATGEYLILYLNSSGTAVEQKRYPSNAALTGAIDELYWARFAEFEERRRRALSSTPKALILVLLGQSNNAPRNTAISGVLPNAYMPVGGNSITRFAFYSTNAEHSTIWADVASASSYTEGSTETPGSGMITTLLAGNFNRVYECSVAIGSRSLFVLSGHGPRNNLYAVVHKMCDHARTAGYDPMVVFSSHHGEANMADATTEANYYTYGLAYYRMCQILAAQAMEKPDYIAPIVLHHPIEMKDGTAGADSRAIHKAILRIATDLPGAIHGGASYQYDSESDRIHQTALGFRQRGERVGQLLRDYLAGVKRSTLQITDVTLSGTTVVATFNEEIVRDTNFSYGTNLNASQALAGFEYLDNGSGIQITGIAVAGRKATLTLASTPVGTIDQQVLRIATQTTTATLTSGANNRSGSQIRVNETGLASIYDATYTHYRWAVPQICSVRAA